MKGPLIRINNFYNFLSAFAGALAAGLPGRKMCVIGVTGTKGKTSAIEILNAILTAAGKRTAVFSSLRMKIGSESSKNMTDKDMPGPGHLPRLLQKAQKNGAEYALVEITSEGARAHRHRFIKWSLAALTNLHPEHIELHGSLENYRRAKLYFLEYAAGQGAKVFLNQNDSGSEYFWERLPANSAVFFSSSLLPEFSPKIYRILKGDFNKDNVALAVAIAEYLHLDRETIQKGLLNFRGIPGRLEYVAKEPFSVVVDYANTPDSLEAVYQTVKPKDARLICVLGAAGGSGDKWKRPIFGKIASDYCEEIILTNENPFDENPELILQEIAAGAKNKKVKKILDRKNAIFEAVKMAGPKDTVVITGKGSEPWMRVAHGKKFPWSERLAVEEALEKRKSSAWA